MDRLQQQYSGLGSDIIITLVGDKAVLPALFNEIHHAITAFEQRFSRFLPDSELTQVNKQAGKTVAVSPEFATLALASKQYSSETNGLYNPFILPALQNAGYVGSWPSPAAAHTATIFAERQVTEPSKLTINNDHVHIPPGTALDFGGIGKGYLLDVLSNLLAGKKLGGYWLSLGGDIMCGGYDIDSADWQVGIQDAHQADSVIATFRAANGTPLAIATSGTTKRKGIAHGHEWHHIIDPRTGAPVQTAILTVSVSAASGTQADVYAKSILIAGEPYAHKLKAEGKIRSFVIQYHDAAPEIVI
ncbi:MAG TPA: FAD:protein FMN transferase [Candidatus Saccharimonadales bacterium]